MKYDFDRIIDRKGTNCLNVEGWRGYIFKCGPERKFAYADDEFVRMWVADMEFAVAPEIRQAIKDRVDREIFGYTLVYDPDYVKAFQNWCESRYGWTFPAEQLTYSAGVIPALYQLTEDLVAKDEKIITFTPAYGFFLHACEYNGVELLQSPLKCEHGKWSLDWDDCEAKAADPKAKLLMLCNPHNPTGYIWTEEELTRIGEICAKHDLWIVSDEIHCDLVRTGLSHTPMGKVMPDYDKLVTCMSASKTFNMAGMMHSHIIIRNDEERERFKSRDKTVGDLNPLSLAAHKAAYEQGGEWLRQLREYLDGNFQLLKDFLDANYPECEFEIPGATYLAWVNMGKALPGEKDLCSFFANKAGILLEGGDSLFVGNAEGWIRLNLAMPRSILEDGFARMKKAIDAARA